MRMSAKKRITLGQAMVARWTSAGCESDRSARFVSDMLVRLESGKSMTTRQRAWFDSAVFESPKSPQNEELVNRLRDAATLPGMESEQKPLLDFARVVGRGWSLSEKQIAFMHSLLDKEENIRKNGPWAPTSDELASIELGVALCRRYDKFPTVGTFGIVTHVKKFNDWRQGEVSVLNEWSGRKLMTCFKSDRKAFTDALNRWPVGSLVEMRSDGSHGLVVDEPFVDNRGRPALMVLLNGGVGAVSIHAFVKPRKQRKKKVASDRGTK